MNLGDLIALAREPVHLDDQTQPPLWSDAVLTTLFNDAVRQHCIRTRSLIESQNPSICRYAVPAGTNAIKLHPSILAVRTARIAFVDGYEDGCSRGALEGRTLRWLKRRQPNWETHHAGRPLVWIPDWQEGWLAFDRPVEADATLVITAWRLPLENEMLDANDLDGEPMVAEHWRQDLVDWVVYRALNGADAEMRNEQKAAAAAEAFESKTGRLPSANEVRLWGVSPIVGTLPQFL